MPPGRPPTATCDICTGVRDLKPHRRQLLCSLCRRFAERELDALAEEVAARISTMRSIAPQNRQKTFSKTRANPRKYVQ